MNNTNLFIAWNNVLCNHFFPDDLEKDAEVSLYIDRATINSIGNELGGYDGFMNVICMSVNDRLEVYHELRRRYGMAGPSTEQNRQIGNSNIFKYATIYIDTSFYSHLDCPFLVYIVFIILMASESAEQTNRGIGNYITERLRQYFQNHPSNRDAFETLFNALADRHPQFHAQKITQLPYIGLVRYQLVLSKNQVDALNRAMFSADLSEEIPYKTWVEKIRDYVDDPIKTIMNNSLEERAGVLRKRITDLRLNFDPVQYEKNHREERTEVKGRFVLAVYEDYYDAKDDKLVLLTDINNKDVSGNGLTINKGNYDRLGEYAEYNINHVLINGGDRAEMKSYSLSAGNDVISPMPLGNIVLFSRWSDYLIQTIYPQKGRETWILVRNGHDDDLRDWLGNHGLQSINRRLEDERLHQIFGAGWDCYISNEIEYIPTTNRSCYRDGSVVRDGGIKCIGKNEVYLASALPYYEFPGPINKDLLYVSVFCGEERTECEYEVKIVDDNKLVIDLKHIDHLDHSYKLSIDIKYKYGEGQRDIIQYEDSFYIISQDVEYNDSDLWAVDMWGNIVDDPTGFDHPYMKGFKVCNNGENVFYGGERLGEYHATGNERSEIDVSSRHFYLVSLIASVCSMRNDFAITETWLKRCIRYAATRFDIAVDSSFYRDVRYLLINSGYINADYDNQRYQPLPPSFIKTPVQYYMLTGSYTDKFLSQLASFCAENNVTTVVRSSNDDSDAVCSLMPPVILLTSNFDPDRFVEETGCRCQIIEVEDVARSMMRALPSYKDYERTLVHIPNEVFNNRLQDAEGNEFPRVRKSRAIGYGSTCFIEKTMNDYYRITVPDHAWAHLYCLYKRGRTICLTDPNSLTIRRSAHLPVMMQRMLFLTNFGMPQRRKTFICFNDENVYYNEIKRYVVHESTVATRKREAIRCIAGDSNDTVRECRSRVQYRLYFWHNIEKSSTHPRTMLVLTDHYDKPLGFAIKENDQMKVYLENADRYKRVSGVVFHNEVFSQYMTTAMTYDNLGIRFDEEFAQLPPADLYEKERIDII